MKPERTLPDELTEGMVDFTGTVVQDDQFPETTREFETTTYGVYIKDPPMERLCKNCRFWEKHYHCQHPMNSQGDFSIMMNLPENRFDLLYCPPDFGCIHFEESE